MTYVAATRIDGVAVSIDTETVSALIPFPGSETTHSIVYGTTMDNLVVQGDTAAVLAALGLASECASFVMVNSAGTLRVRGARVQQLVTVAAAVTRLVMAPEGRRFDVVGTLAAVATALDQPRR